MASLHAESGIDIGSDKTWAFYKKNLEYIFSAARQANPKADQALIWGCMALMASVFCWATGPYWWFCVGFATLGTVSVGHQIFARTYDAIERREFIKGFDGRFVCFDCGNKWERAQEGSVPIHTPPSIQS